MIEMSWWQFTGYSVSMILLGVLIKVFFDFVKNNIYSKRKGKEKSKNKSDKFLQQYEEESRII